MPADRRRHSVTTMPATRPSDESSGSGIGSKPAKHVAIHKATSVPTSIITLPMQCKEVIHYSSLLDPQTNATTGWSVKSPSGNLLGPNGFFNHPHRPLSLRERRERVLAGLEKAQVEAIEEEASVSPEASSPQCKKGRKWSCFG